MSAQPKLHFTPQEYLELELAAEYKSQYIAGEIFAMAGAQPWHDRVANNIRSILHVQFRGRPCEYFSSDMRVRVEAADMYTYPDVSALCGEPKFETASDPHSLLNPQVIFEVLSPSTQAFDRGSKFDRYRKLTSLTDYVLVASERIRVEQHVRQPSGAWQYAEYEHPSSQLRLASLDCALTLADIYERVEFPGR